MTVQEYLVGYGVRGDLGRFRPTRPLDCVRGDEVVIQTERGVELGHVLRKADDGLAAFFPNTTVGKILRLASEEDQLRQREHQGQIDALLARASELAAVLAPNLLLLDVEVLLDGEHAVIHHLRLAECDVRPLVSTLSREWGSHILLEDHTAPKAHEHEHAGCGEGGCGSCGEGGCGSCGEGGCGSCGSAESDEKARFAALREQMEKQRVSLL